MISLGTYIDKDGPTARGIGPTFRRIECVIGAFESQLLKDEMRSFGNRLVGS